MSVTFTIEEPLVTAEIIINIGRLVDNTVDAYGYHYLDMRVTERLNALIRRLKTGKV